MNILLYEHKGPDFLNSANCC